MLSALVISGHCAFERASAILRGMHRSAGSLLCNRDARLLPGSWARAADENLHFFEGNEAIFVGIHRLEDALVSRLKFQQ
jgi:hypothetical protein